MPRFFGHLYNQIFEPEEKMQIFDRSHPIDLMKLNNKPTPRINTFARMRNIVIFIVEYYKEISKWE